MAQKNLEGVLKAAGNTVQMLRNSQIGAYVYPVVPSEFTNWRDEQRAWRDTRRAVRPVAPHGRAHHQGPGCAEAVLVHHHQQLRELPGRTGPSRWCRRSYDGYVIGDGILFHLDKDELLFVGRAPTVNWLQFHCETGGFKVDFIRDDRSPSHPRGKAVTRRHYRFQIQGPNAKQILDKINGGPIPDVKFFTMDEINIKGRKVRCLRHGMAGAPGLEIWGPYAEGDEIRDYILEAGREFGIVPVGSRAYASNTLESGWIPSPLPARVHRREHEEVPRVAAGQRLRSHGLDRRQLRLRQHRGLLRHAVRARLRPVREVRPRLHRRRSAQEDRRQAASQEGHVRLARGRHGEDLRLAVPARARITTSSSTCRSRTTPRRRTTRSSRTARPSASRCSAATATTSAPRCRSASSIPNIEIGEQLTLVWGEENGGTKKTTVEKHKQLDVRVTISPVPYSRVVRDTYAAGWRTAKHGYALRTGA